MQFEICTNIEMDESNIRYQKYHWMNVIAHESEFVMRARKTQIFDKDKKNMHKNAFMKY